MSFSIVATHFRFSRALAAARRHRTRSIALAVLVAVLAGGGWLALSSTSGKSAATKRTAGGTSCARRLLADWADGRIDHTYPIACYRRAMQSLPTDLEVYSSAPEDIASALQERILLSRDKTARHVAG